MTELPGRNTDQVQLFGFIGLRDRFLSSGIKLQTFVEQLYIWFCLGLFVYLSFILSSITLCKQSSMYHVSQRNDVKPKSKMCLPNTLGTVNCKRGFLSYPCWSIFPT